MSRSTTLRFIVLLALAAPLAVLSVSRAHAQVDPLWDHYKVYWTQPTPGPTITFQLVDQFGPFDHSVVQLERFMNPTQKQVAGGPPPPDITNPILHYSWWAITRQPFNTVVGAVNQFGDHTLNVFDAVYLLNPALKNQPGATPPTANHYKCYDCDGPPVNVPVILTDQFGSFQTIAAVPRFLCNPVEKRLPTGEVYTIQDPNQHYVCYELLPPDARTFTATMTDQFLTEHSMALGPSDLLCVPTFKTEPTGASTGTWGRLKVLYR